MDYSRLRRKDLLQPIFDRPRSGDLEIAGVIHNPDSCRGHFLAERTGLQHFALWTVAADS